METNLSGGWSAYSTTISSEAKKAFDEAFKQHDGVHYKPLAVAHQVVSGKNYRFFCNAKGVYPGAVDYAALVEVYAPLQQPAHITSIKKVD